MRLLALDGINKSARLKEVCRFAARKTELRRSIEFFGRLFISTARTENVIFLIEFFPILSINKDRVFYGTIKGGKDKTRRQIKVFSLSRLDSRTFVSRKRIEKSRHFEPARKFTFLYIANRIS